MRYVDGKPKDGCPNCGNEDVSDRDWRAREYAGGTEEPPYRMVCDGPGGCGHEWEENE